MISPKERAEKIRSAPRNSERFIRKMTPEEHEKHLRRALEHDNDAGMSSTDEYVYLKHKETNGK